MRTGLTLAFAVLLVPGARAVDIPITTQLIDEAVVLGQSPIEALRTRFHAPYRLLLARPPIDYLEVVTPFRRMVLLAEERQRLGGRGFTQREAAAALGDRASLLEIAVELTFHPLNVFVGVPGYDVVLEAGAAPGRTPPQQIWRTPRFGPRLEPPAPPPAVPPVIRPPAASMPVTGGTIVAEFDAGSLDPRGAYDVIVRDGETELGRIAVELGALR